MSMLHEHVNGNETGFGLVCHINPSSTREADCLSECDWLYFLFFGFYTCDPL